MRNFPPFPCRTNEAILLVGSYHKGEMTGWLIHPQLENQKEIHSIPQMLFLLDELLLQEERFVRLQAFEPTGHDDIPRIATLRIQILFRENYTWQGCLLWEEQKKEASFRSVLELIQILDEILED